jgi:hypothetical protein
MSPARFWCDYRDLEEFKAGMWRRIAAEPERERWRGLAVAFLLDSAGMLAAMRRVLAEWPTSCLSAFTNPSLNKPVWLAHAGACLTQSIPEEFMRLAYWDLPQDDRDRADRDAQTAAGEWREPCSSGTLKLTF